MKLTIIILIISVCAFGQAPKESVFANTKTGTSSTEVAPLQLKMSAVPSGNIKDDTTRVPVTAQQLEHMVAVINERNAAKVEAERRELEYQRAMLFMLGLPVEQVEGLILDEKKGEFKYVKKPKQ